MNIHVTKDYLDNLNENDYFGMTPFGSRLFGTETSGSDLDCIFIMKNLDKMPAITHHVLQVKTYNSDLIFCTLDQFISNTLNGDNTINYELIMLDVFKGTKLEFLHSFKDLFTNYTILKSYLGRSKKDMKSFKYCKSDADRHKKLAYIYSALSTVANILAGENLIITPKSYKKVVDFELALNNFSELEEVLRSALNSKLEDKKIHKTFDSSRYKEFLIEYNKISSEQLESEKFKEMITDTYIDYLGKDVNY